MWTRKALKQSARTSLKGNYWQAVVVCLVLAFIVGAFPTQFSIGIDADAMARTSFRSLSNTSILNEFVSDIDEVSPVMLLMEQSNATQGILAGVFNNITSSGSFVFGVLNALDQFIFGDAIMPGIIMLAGTLIMFLFWMFVGNLLRVGACRFFLETKAYPGARANRLLYLFRIRRVWRPALIMLLKTVYTVLWSLTIVGGIIKIYSYRMVPYIIAENPDIRPKQAFALSRKMMNGHKWHAFLLDLSFLGWAILSSATLGILGYLYYYPYQSAADAELYFLLRAQVPEEAALLNDPYLCGGGCPVQPGVPAEYPVNLYPIPEAKEMAWLGTDYNTQYSFFNIVLMFFTFCFAGWCWEVFVDLVNKGVFVNRGTLHGPWLPIYGTGGVGVVLLFRRFGGRPWLTFSLVTLFCGVLEYVTSWALETFAGTRWWDYTGYVLNINGRVCLEGLLVFGIGGCAAIYFAAPALNNLFNRLPGKLKKPLCVGLLALFAADVAISAFHPNLAPAESDEKLREQAAISQPGGTP